MNHDIYLSIFILYNQLRAGSNKVPCLPAAGAVGMAIDGVPMFPNYNKGSLPRASFEQGAPFIVCAPFAL